MLYLGKILAQLAYPLRFSLGMKAKGERRKAKPFR